MTAPTVGDRKAPAHPNTQTVPEGGRPCPICGATMIVERKEGVQIDVCEAHGIWLDKGELPQLVFRVTGLSRIRQRQALDNARRRRKVQGALLGFWSLLLD